MKKTMFQYTKNILERVSFDPNLFCKEVQKALKTLLPFEIEQLTEWLSEFIKEKPELRHCQILLNP
jgi:DNA replication protein DnaD